VDLAAILTGLAAILTGTGGVILVIREFRRRDRRECQRDVDELVDDLHLLRQDFAEFRRWSFQMQERAIDAGADVSEPPLPHPLAPTDHEGLRLLRGALRHRRGADDGDGGAGV